ncbi:MAG TPA: ribosome recycling factor [Bacillota bacterium]|nr:ribosome recycling factor [Bacillota bacterium]HPE38858.1 ribosome recycling factor [Bacillota bacterium]
MIEITKNDYDQYEEKMKKTISSLGENFNAIRAGRANPHVLDRITVDYYGTQSPLNAVANIQVPDPRMITLTPWDPSMLREIEKAIQSSDLGINPSNDGKIIRLAFPILTEERRKELVKSVQKYGEEGKVAIRNIRRDAIDKYRSLHKKKELTDDDIADFEEKIQKLTDKYIKEVEKCCEAKEKDLMAI